MSQQLFKPVNLLAHEPVRKLLNVWHKLRVSGACHVQERPKGMWYNRTTHPPLLAMEARHVRRRLVHTHLVALEFVQLLLYKLLRAKFNSKGGLYIAMYVPAMSCTSASNDLNASLYTITLSATVSVVHGFSAERS